MPVPLASRQRDGSTVLYNAARVLCRIVTEFAPTLRAKYPSNEAMMALLTAIEAICPLIEPAFEPLIEADRKPNQSVPG